MLDDFWRRKEEAAANKARVSEALAGPRHHNPILDYHENRMKKEKPVVSRPPIHPGARNPQEAEYLRQLEQIRKQNYKDRQIMRGNTPSVDRPSSNNKVSVAGDPKVDPDARRRKIQELKEQADRRAAMLKEQLEKRRQQIEKQVEKDRMERMKKWRQERENCRASPTPQVYQPPKREDNKKEEKKEIAVPSIGMETAMREVGQPKLFRSLSEGEIHNLVKPQKRENIRRKAWGAADKNAIPSFANIPLEITASAMEATRVIEPTIKNEVEQSFVNQDKNEPRKGWDNQGKTQFVSKLHDMDLLGTQIPTMTINNIDSKDVPKPGQTITIENKRDVAKPGETIILNKDIPKQGETITLEHSANKSSIPNIGGNSNKTIVLSVDKNDVENSKRGEVSPIRQEKTLNNENQDGSTDSKKLQKLSSNENKEQEPTSQSANEKLEVTQSTNQGSEKEKFEVDDLEVIEISDNKVETEVSVEDKTNEKTVKNAWSDGVSQKPPESTPEKLSNIEVNKSPTDTQSRHETSGDSSVEMSEEECSFHTPNRSFGLQSGSYDIKEKKLLRTCSLPDLRPAALDDVIEEDEENSEEHASDKQESEVKDVKEEDNREANEDEEEEEEEEEDEEEEVSDAEADADDDDEFDDYESMLESMRNVLGKTAVTMENGQANEQENNEEDEDEDDEWEEERDDEEVSNKNQKNVLQTDGGDRENLFSRIEESRMALENELGMDLFIKVYRHVQMMQDNEDDELEMGTTEISQLLGDKENLYQKILYLVIADSAYSEGNDGTF
ncbi:serine/threonine-protein kinase Nek1-like [Clytia hemisphaerica]|uniref:serine/threonine-protein kinase Nek1-like n=1 Tax=Clytia hemisphaerica TaxID=252671 RepID=UPI0034D72867